MHPARRTALVALLSTAACSANMATEPLTRRPPLLTIGASSGGGTFPPPEPTLRYDSASVTISGVLATPTPCYALAATDTVAERTLTVRLRAAPTNAGGACVAMIGNFPFTVQSLDVPAGVTRVRLEQTGAAGGVPALMLDQPIRIPF